MCTPLKGCIDESIKGNNSDNNSDKEWGLIVSNFSGEICQWKYS